MPAREKTPLGNSGLLIPVLCPPPCSGTLRDQVVPGSQLLGCTHSKTAEVKYKGDGASGGQGGSGFAVGSSVPAPCPYFSFLPDSRVEDCHSARCHLGIRLQPGTSGAGPSMLAVQGPSWLLSFLGTN